MYTSLQRIMDAVKHKETDVVPVGPYMGNHGAYAAGVKLKDYYTNGKVMADAQYRAWEIYGQDIVVPQSDGYYMAEALGTITEIIDENSMPVIKKYAIDSLDEVPRLKRPDPYKDGRMPVYLEATSLLAERLGGNVCIRSTGTGPFSLASHLLGIDKFLMAIIEAEYDNDLIKQKAILDLMEITTCSLTDFAAAQLEAGANIVQCGDSLASLDVISPLIYEKYVFPFEKKFFHNIMPIKEKHNGVALLHICGNNMKILDLLAQTGADILEVDYKMDMKFIKNSVGDKVCIMGNLNPAGNLLRGSAEVVMAEAAQCIKNAGSGGGFILGSGCEVAIFTPRENIKAMIKAARSCFRNHEKV